MSDHKNTILAIVLSLIVIVGWQYFIGYPQVERQRQQTQQETQQQTQLKQQGPAQPGASAPNAAQPATPEVPGTPTATSPSAQAQAASREAVIGASPRIAIETARVGGSINLKGGRIDDLTLTQYREEIDPNSPPIVLFSPSGAPASLNARRASVAPRADNHLSAGGSITAP